MKNKQNSCRNVALPHTHTHTTPLFASPLIAFHIRRYTHAHTRIHVASSVGEDELEGYGKEEEHFKLMDRIIQLYSKFFFYSK
jgi:hypothetical protein